MRPDSQGEVEEVVADSQRVVEEVVADSQREAQIHHQIYDVSSFIL